MMKKVLPVLLLVLITCLSCKKDENTDKLFDKTIIISGIEPSTVTIGSIVKILGTKLWKLN